MRPFGFWKECQSRKPRIHRYDPKAPEPWRPKLGKAGEYITVVKGSPAFDVDDLVWIPDMWRPLRKQDDGRWLIEYPSDSINTVTRVEEDPPLGFDYAAWDRRLQSLMDAIPPKEAYAEWQGAETMPMHLARLWLWVRKIEKRRTYPGGPGVYDVTFERIDRPSLDLMERNAA